jgi:hypothetical protein
MDVYALGTDGHPYKATWNSSIGWGSGWSSMSNNMASSPAAIQYGSEMDVFYRGGDNNIYKDTWNGSTWGGFGSLGAPTGTTITGDPSVLSYTTPGEYDIYVNTTSGHIYKRTWNGSWSSWTDMGGSYVGSPYAMQYGNDMHIFARASGDSTIWTRYWSNSGQTWSSWQQLSLTRMGSDASAMQYGASELDAYTTSGSASSYHDTSQDGSTWGGFSSF